MANSNVESMYRELEDDMKACFLYTGLFPPNYEIPASTLTQLWIAESFIHPPHGRTSEELADEVLEHLINQQMLRAEKMRLDQVKTCKVDDSFRKFCKEKAEELNLFTVIKPPVHEGQNLYRLCFHSDPSDFLSEQPRPNRPNVRSFLCLLEEPLRLDPKNMSTIPNAFKPLRVLSCESTKLDKLPDIQKLILLKHVTLFIDKLDFLPTEISHLLNLQTLIVNTTSDYIRVKANIWKMMQLRHLKTKVFFILDDKKWNRRAARSLQTLSRLSPESCTEHLHEKAPNMRKLGIRGKLEGLFERFSLVNFTHLENLTLENYSSYGAAYCVPLNRLPDLQAFPLNLKKLSLSKTYLIWDRHMLILADIHTLEVLKVKDHAFKGANWNVNRAFQNLRYLLIENTDLNNWTVPADHFPKLKCLEIKKCRLEKLPDRLNRDDLTVVIE